MNRLTVWIIVAVIIAGLVLALKKQLEVNGEQRTIIAQQSTALKAAETLRKEAESATTQRDTAVARITETNRRLQREITKALTGDACAVLPIPPALDQLLRERAPRAREGLPSRHRSAGAADPRLGG